MSDLTDSMGEKRYETKTKGERVQPGVRLAAR